MSKKVIAFSLSEAGITQAIRELEAYRADFERKLVRFRDRVAERLANHAASGFSRAVVDDLLNGAPRRAQVTVSVEQKASAAVVIASGTDAVWVEFGAGVYHNGPAGSSPHPNGAELGFTIGGYGKGMGSRQVWGYYEGGELQLTHGAPASMPMYHAMKTVCDELDGIAREVFG